MTIEQKFINLINADVDGALDDIEKAELQVFLEQSAEGRALHNELSSLCTALDSVELMEPPPHMRHVIMGRVKPAQSSSRSPGFLSSFFNKPALTHAVTFAAGVLIALSLLNSELVSTTAFDDVTGLVGTVGGPVEAELLSVTSFDTSEVAGKVSLRTSGTLLILDFDLATIRPIDVEADYTDRTVWLNGFAQWPENSNTTISAENGRVNFSVNGKRRYAVYLRNDGSRAVTIDLRFLAGGAVVHQARLDYEPGARESRK